MKIQSALCALLMSTLAFAQKEDFMYEDVVNKYNLESQNTPFVTDKFTDNLLSFTQGFAIGIPGNIFFTHSIKCYNATRDMVTQFRIVIQGPEPGNTLE